LAQIFAEINLTLPWFICFLFGFFARTINEMASANETLLQEAATAYQTGQFTTLKAAAAHFGVNRRTLGSRLNNTHQNHSEGALSKQRLSPAQEEELVRWILAEDSRGFPPSFARARQMASHMMAVGGDTAPLGKNWLQGFIRRNPQVKSTIGRPVELNRIKAATPEAIDDFLNRFQDACTRLHITTDNIWNMDETGLDLGASGVQTVLADSRKRRAVIGVPPRQEWVSIIECVSAAGRSLPPAVIFKGEGLQSSWLTDLVDGWHYATSENGWTSNDLGLSWLRDVFLPQTGDASHPRMLVIDGHGSHLSVEFSWMCKAYNVEMVFLPPHASHILQPLDLACFSPLKTHYRSQVAELSAYPDHTRVKKSRFLEIYKAARSEALTERIIRAGWRKSGMVPFNRAIPLANEQLTSSARLQTPPPQEPEGEGPSFETPKGPRQTRELLQVLCPPESSTSTTRLAANKVVKGVGKLTAALAMAKAKLEQAEKQIAELQQPARGRRVPVERIDGFASAQDVSNALGRVQEGVEVVEEGNTGSIAWILRFPGQYSAQQESQRMVGEGYQSMLINF